MIDKQKDKYKISIAISNRAELDELLTILNAHKDFIISKDDTVLSIYFDSIDYYRLKDDSPLRENNSMFKGLLTDIESIKNYGINNGKRVYFNYNKERKVENRKGKIKERLGYSFYAKDFSKTNNDLGSAYINRIICGDSINVLTQYPDNSIDLILTSPPYNFGLNYNKHNDTSTWHDYFDKLFKVFQECIRILKYGGRLVINIQPMYSDYIPAHHLISNFLFTQGLIWKSEILWEKNNYNCKYTAWGSWKSPSNPYMKYTWEYIEVFCKGTLKKEGKNPDITSEEFKQWVLAKWSIAPERHMKEFNHPAMFPEELAKRVIKLFSFPNDIVLDPFNGAGTTTYMAKILGRNYIGIDISEAYCQTAKKRLQVNDLFIK